MNELTKNEIRNQVVLVGNVVANAEIINSRNGNIVNFRLAVNDSYKNKNTGELVKKAVFVCVTAYDISTETAQILVKGRRVRIEGKLGFDQWVSPHDGSKKSRVFVHAFAIEDAPREALTPSNTPRQTNPPAFKGVITQKTPHPQAQTQKATPTPRTGGQKIVQKARYNNAANF